MGAYRFRRCAAAFVALGLVIAACGDDDAASTGAASSEGDAVTTAASAAEREPTPGGSLVYGTYGEGSGFDPIKRGLGYCNTAIYDSLLRFDDAGEPEPYMAVSMESPDNTVWTLKLRDGVTSVTARRSTPMP